VSTNIDKACGKRTKKIKSKGIALCHKLQGYGANNRPISLLMKSELSPDQLTEDVIKALRQVTLEISFEEYLRRFFDMWSCDAENLAFILGFKTEWEEYLEQCEPEQVDNYREFMEERLSYITLLKAANEGKTDFTLEEEYELIKAQQQFEKALKMQPEEKDLDKAGNQPAAEPAAEPEKVPAEPAQQDPVDPETEPATEPEQKPDPVVEEPKDVDVTKSQEYIDLLKRYEEMEARVAKADEIIKAAVEVRRKEAEDLLKSFAFINDEQVASLVDFVMDESNSAIVEVMKAANQMIEEAKAETVKAREEFGLQKEVGTDAAPEVNDLVKSAEDIIKENVSAAIAARKNVEE
jgi:hypothetical protein